MIQLEHLHIEEFRGIRNIDIPLGCESFVVHGPNGSGKSGVVDAIDFALTGNIRRLAGQGTREVSVPQHAPHVSIRDTPSASSVSLTVRDLATGKTAVLKRSVETFSRYTLTPDDTDVRVAVEKARVHPELTLSRRDIIQYVVSPPTTRATQIQALLKLDKLGAFRANLGGAMRKAGNEVNASKTNLTTVENNFRAHLGTADVEATAVLTAINERRQTLGASEFTTLLPTTDFMMEVTAESGTTTVNLVGAIAETSALAASLADLTYVDAHRSTLSVELDKAENGNAILLAIQRRGLLETGLAAVTDEACPLCGLDWPTPEALRAHIAEEITQSEEARQFLAGLETPRESYVAAINDLRVEVSRVIPAAEEFGDRELPQLLRTWSNALAAHANEFSTNERTLRSAEELSVRRYNAPDGTTEKLTALDARLSALPAQSATVDARTFLALANERWTQVKLERERVEQAITTGEVADAVYEAYCQAMDEALNSLYYTVQEDFSRYYGQLNADDESTFSARLTPSQGSLAFEVDFYGIDMFPPNAYHSEGHQDGMGVCLYFALMKQTLGDDFRLAILDDVVMSVDVNHRLRFCELLKSEFPHVQFVITTHDIVWARQMQSAGLITGKQQARFYGWSVDDGPLYERSDIWDRIEEDLAKDDVNGAAHKLRRHLEAAAADIAEAIGASVQYRSDARYDLSDFIAAVKGRHGELLKKAANAANSYSDAVAMAKVQALRDTRATALHDQEGEAWAINPLVHNSDWANLSVNDFRPAFNSAREFLALFRCENESCGGWIHSERHSPESLRCDCGNYFVNLSARQAN